MVVEELKRPSRGYTPGEWAVLCCKSFLAASYTSAAYRTVRATRKPK
jgi:hypothetical protein